MLTAIYYILQRDLPYSDLGPAHLDRINRVRTVNRLVHRLNDLGYRVTLECPEQAA
jgi:hypothetical protein